MGLLLLLLRQCSFIYSVHSDAVSGLPRIVHRGLHCCTQEDLVVSCSKHMYTVHSPGGSERRLDWSSARATLPHVT